MANLTKLEIEAALSSFATTLPTRDGTTIPGTPEQKVWLALCGLLTGFGISLALYELHDYTFDFMLHRTTKVRAPSRAVGEAKLVEMICATWESNLAWDSHPGTSVRMEDVTLTHIDGKPVSDGGGEPTT